MASAYAFQDELITFLLARNDSYWCRTFPWYNEVFCFLEDEVISFKLGGKSKNIEKIEDVEYLMAYRRGVMYSWSWGSEALNENESGILQAVFKSENDGKKLSLEMDRIRQVLSSSSE